MIIRLFYSLIILGSWMLLPWVWTLFFLILGVIVFSTYVEGLILALIFDSFLFLGMTTLSWESFLGFTCLVSIILIFRTLISRYLVIVYN